MPTGYTAPIGEGQSFPDFVMSCARAFGALVTMRDEPSDAVIPDEFVPTDHHVKNIKRLKSKLASIEKLTQEEVREAAHLEFVDTVHQRDAWRTEKMMLRDKYEEMLEKVNAWTPPSNDHYGLKRFMIQQIEESIRHDCWEYDDELVEDPPDVWLSKKKEAIHKSIAYHEKEDREERERVAGRNRWVRELRWSLVE
jgi:hypothetical protein